MLTRESLDGLPALLESIGEIPEQLALPFPDRKVYSFVGRAVVLKTNRSVLFVKEGSLSFNIVALPITLEEMVLLKQSHDDMSAFQRDILNLVAPPSLGDASCAIQDDTGSQLAIEPVIDEPPILTSDELFQKVRDAISDSKVPNGAKHVAQLNLQLTGAAQEVVRAQNALRSSEAAVTKAVDVTKRLREERNAANEKLAAALKERDAANEARAAIEEKLAAVLKERDAANEARSAAEEKLAAALKERDAANEARAAIEEKLASAEDEAKATDKARAAGEKERDDAQAATASALATAESTTSETGSKRKTPGEQFDSFTKSGLNYLQYKGKRYKYIDAKIVIKDLKSRGNGIDVAVDEWENIEVLHK